MTANGRVAWSTHAGAAPEARPRHAGAAPEAQPRQAGAAPEARPKVVCFDLGGVIVRICRTFREGCLAAGVPYRGEVLDGADSAALTGTSDLARLVFEHQSGRLACERFHASLSALSQGRFDETEFRRVHEAWILGEYEGVAELIDAIHSAGVESACLSNTNESHWNSMRGMRAFDSIRHKHASHVLGLCKPDAAIFRAFEERTGFDGASILYFDDLIENVIAAGARGWRAALVDPAMPTAPQLRRVLEREGVLRA